MRPFTGEHCGHIGGLYLVRIGNGSDRKYGTVSFGHTEMALEGPV